jgi:opacity protein-like surface antigen
MSIVTRYGTLAVILAALCPAVSARAQVAPVQYWLPNGLFGFGGGWTDAGGAGTYRNFPGFDARYVAQDASSDWRDNFRTGMFAGSQSGNIGLNGLGLNGAASDFGGLSYQSALSGYAFKGAGDLPSSVYVGFDKLSYRPGIGSPLAPFSSDASINAGYRARAGVAFQPTANVTLSFEASVTQQGSGDSDINSPLLPALSPFSGVRR